MKILLCITTLLACLSMAAFAADDAAPADDKSASDASEASYTKAIEGRADDILKILALTDTNKISVVHDAIVAQYRALKAWHSANDPLLKSSAGDTNAIASMKASLKTIHDGYIAKLSENLTPAQVDQVKDKMVYNKVQVTYNAYCDIIPQLTDAQKAHILEVLKQAREEAMDGGSVNEKSAIFKKYKGRIANYLSKEGVDEAKARKEWFARTHPAPSTNAPVQK